MYVYGIVSLQELSFWIQTGLLLCKNWAHADKNKYRLFGEYHFFTPRIISLWGSVRILCWLVLKWINNRKKKKHYFFFFTIQTNTKTEYNITTSMLDGYKQLLRPRAPFVNLTHSLIPTEMVEFVSQNIFEDKLGDGVSGGFRGGCRGFAPPFYWKIYHFHV